MKPKPKRWTIKFWKKMSKEDYVDSATMLKIALGLIFSWPIKHNLKIVVTEE